MRQRASLLPVITLPALLLAACATSPATTTLTRETVRYGCAEDAEMVVSYGGRATGLDGTAELVWDGQTFLLKQDISGSGVRYSDGSLALLTKGDEAFVEKAGEIVLRDCKARP